MSMEIKQHLKLSQQLVMTPQLQQAIKLLQLSRAELVDVVRESCSRTRSSRTRSTLPRSSSGRTPRAVAEASPQGRGRVERIGETEMPVASRWPEKAETTPR
jgi:RNA polymerase sigma-54 factor